MARVSIGYQNTNFCKKQPGYQNTKKTLIFGKFGNVPRGGPYTRTAISKDFEERRVLERVQWLDEEDQPGPAK